MADQMLMATGDDRRCLDGCRSEELATGRELGDGAAMRCFSCGKAVCIGCGTTPAPLNGWLCDSCGELD
ncbi:hypothetical protein STBA_71570 [Streptomyces sp. MP131-18]|nr:hypothetical protein STBA_71570 [Streptomyces sp. MP131-18]